MAAVSLTAPPPPFSCHLCEGPSWVDKAGPGCGGCPAFKGSHYFPNGEGPEDCDVLFLGDKPEAPPKRPGQPEAMVIFHPAFQCDGGKVIRSAAFDLGRRAQFKGLTARFVYGVKCAVDTPNKATILACQTPLKEELARIAAARRRVGKTRPLVIVALGTTALKSIGISVQSEKEASGRTYEHQIGDMHLTVVFAMSLKAIAVAVGKYASLLVDLERAYLAANNTSIEITPREELAVGYIIPKSIAEVRAVCELILSYSENGVPPDAWMISTDSETRTLYPWKHDIPKPAIAVSFSWAAGKATAITLWHPFAPYDPDEAWEIVKTVLEGPKPQAYHNCLTEDMLVTLADGTHMTLGAMVRQRHPGPVLTLNEVSRRIEAKPVIGWVTAPSRTWSDWLCVRVRGKGRLRLTRDHVVLTARGRVPAEQLCVGDRIPRAQHDLGVMRRAMIYGSLLGDASLVLQRKAAARAPYFCVSHGKAQHEYALLKARILGDLLKRVETDVPNARGYSAGTGGTLTRVLTRSDSRLFEFLDACIQDGIRTVSDAWTQALTPAAVAIWYCDDGTLASGSHPSICVSGFGPVGAERLVRYLNTQGWPARVDVRDDGHLYIRITGPVGPGMSAGLRGFWKTIAPYVPACMAYKLPAKYQHLAGTEVWEQAASQDVAYDTVTAIGPLARQPGAVGRYEGYTQRGVGPKQYCLTVQDNPNFFAGGLAVSNCKFDLKVFRRHGARKIKLGWDSMLAEHALEEDKKGLYGLKNLVKRFLPRYSGYEDKLGALLEELDRSDEIEGDEETPEMPEEKLPAAVQEALDLLVANKWIKNEKFQVPALTKKMDSFVGKGGDERDPILLAARLLRNAKEGGEFRAKKPDKADTLPEDGGFEELPLDEMLFYACVDADVTRQIAVIQVGRMNDEEAFIAQQRQSYALAKQFGVGVFKYDAPVRPTRARPLYQLAREDYLPRAEVLADIEYRGIRVDRPYLAEAVKKLDAAIASSEMELRRLTDNPKFKPGSAKQLAYHLFDSGLGYVHPDPEKAQLMADRNPDSVRYVGGRILYRARAYTTHGAIQTTEAVLKSLVSRYEDPLADLVLTNKKASKARGSFMKSVDRLSSEAFGRGYIHPNYNLNGTSTGRLSSSSGVKGIGFNNQNIPKGEMGGVKCKKLFITDNPETDLFVNIDAKGAEVSIFAAYARDMKLIEALVAGMDTHCFFSSKVLDPKIIGAGKSGEALRTALEAAGIDADHDWSYEDFFNREDMIKAGLGPNGMTKDGKELHKSLWADAALVSYGKRLKKLRDNIKRVVFGILYGAHAKKIASIAGIEEQLAQTIIELLFAMFPSIPEFVEATKWHLNTFGFVETFHGRRRRFSIKNAPGRLRSQAERRAVNFLIQGTNSDIVMMVLTAITPVIERELRGRVLGTVHDSVMFQIPKIYAGQLKDVVIEYGTKFVARECPWMNPIPYRWDIEVGPSYGELRPLEEYLSGQEKPEAPVGLQGLTEEEIFDALRNATDDDEFKKKAKKKTADKPVEEKEPA